MISTKAKQTIFLSRGFFLLLAGCGMLVLAGCGFHLRGGVMDRVQLPSTYLAGRAGALQQEVLHYLTVSEVPLAQSEKDAQLVIELIGEDVRRRVLSVGIDGKVQEYEVLYTATYEARRAGGKILIPRETLDAQRDYTFNESEVLAKDVEQERLVQDMRSDVVRRLMLRLRAALSKQP